MPSVSAGFRGVQGAWPPPTRGPPPCLCV